MGMRENPFSHELQGEEKQKNRVIRKSARMLGIGGSFPGKGAPEATSSLDALQMHLPQFV
jgi:hypothetical protein